MLHNETFRTPINPLIFEEKINFDSTILSIGSCFAQNIGKRLLENRFNITINPYGVLYNPISIFENLTHAFEGNRVDESLIIENEEIFKHFNFHSDISASSKAELMDQIQSIQQSTFQTLKKVDFLIITLGTSFVFRYNESQQLVANCHKIPSTQFTQELLEVNQMMESFQSLHSLLPENCKVIFTVSPIRHFRNGLVDNSLSKSILRYFTHLVTSQYKNCFYFPAYEIMLDELRDYRFYTNDLVHPSTLAQDYIWSYFDDALIDEKTNSTRQKLEKVIRGLNHKPFNSHSTPHQKFLKKILEISKSIKEINVKDLINEIEQRIN
ncbi:GSCFA domain-containing protein [Flammeovirga aprica]|uniref:GSCFA domain-containing protein n=1 Tax=Flammeovirga aprica JL-4 TaxID=694437 RepID=A0A7X9RW46_9BACT|nr:GSCFA domain-containing protein [Flammeovirga aprica]NME69810.1 GSCFA domain-containing protein [Flammeovirga aprica JL-4]